MSDYRDGREPYGVWVPAHLLVAPQWENSSDPGYDVGTIVGVIGGYEGGGSTAAISYSSYLGQEIEQLYHQAVADETPAAS